jgi:putative NADH-flavin reductase
MRYRTLLVGVFAFLLIFPGTAWAKKHKHAEKGVIMTEVNEAARTVVLTIPGGKGSLSYSVPTSATVTVDEVPAKFEDLHKGMHVTTYTEADEHLLSQIDVQSTK